MVIKRSWVFPVLVLIMLIGHEVFFVGYTFSDDSSYIAQAMRYLSGNYLPPTDHWGFRYTVVIPYAIIGIFTEYNEWLVTLIPLLYWLALLTLVWHFVKHTIGRVEAAYAGLIVVTLPLFVVQSTILGVDITEAFFLFASFVFFYYGEISENKNYKQYFIAGLLLGLAMLTRETAYGFLLVLGVFFLMGGYRHWKSYMVGLLGVLVILSMEWLYYLAFDKGIFYRIETISHSHGSVGLKSGDFDAGSGNISDNRFYGPLLAILVNQEFALLYWTAIISSIYLFINGGKEYNKLLKYVLITFVVYFCWISYSGALRPLPRYYSFTSVLVIIPIVIAINYISKKSIKILFLFIIVGSNFGALSVENIYPRFTSKVISQYIIDTGEKVIIYDKLKTKKVRGFLAYNNADRTLASNEVPENEGYIYANIQGEKVPKEVAKQLVKENILKIFSPPKLLIGYILDITRVRVWMTDDLYKFLAFRNPIITLYSIKGN